MRNSKIGWCHHTHNVWEGCNKVYVVQADGTLAPSACEVCYAAERNNRFHGGIHWGPDAPRLMRSATYWKQPLKWDRAAALADERHRVFCSSLADVFEVHENPRINDRMDEERRRLWALIHETPHLDWLLLTKRPENFARFLPWMSEKFNRLHYAAAPWRNVWLGVTAGSQAAAELRIPILLDTPAVCSFVSCEPILQPIDFTFPVDESGQPALIDLDWVIVGCESGQRARAFDLDWARSVRDQCVVADVPFFLKQIPNPGAARGKVLTEPVVDGRQWTQIPSPLEGAQ